MWELIKKLIKFINLKQIVLIPNYDARIQD